MRTLNPDLLTDQGPQPAHVLLPIAEAGSNATDRAPHPLGRLRLFSRRLLTTCRQFAPPGLPAIWHHPAEPEPPLPDDLWLTRFPTARPSPGLWR